jgi:L-seryl-tRNA(Ser) seleniumtransferase
MDGAPPTRRLAALRSALVPLTQRVAAVTTSGASSTGISIYEELGVQTIINANGPSTRLSGGIPRPEVVDAMARAAESCVDIAHLQGRASEIISELTGAEAGYVTAGAAAGLLLGTAACITRLDPTKMNALPDLTGLKHEVVMARSHRNFYDKAVRSVGVTLVEVGLSDRHAGAGVRDAEPWEFAAAITDNTAAVLYVMNDGMQPSLAEVIEVAHAAGVPVLVDAAAQALPPSNLRKYIDMGADLVAFSGGKVIGGPQASGVLCGRKELVGAAALQHLDQDIYWEQWVPPAQLIDKDSMVGTPHHGIGRVSHPAAAPP